MKNKALPKWMTARADEAHCWASRVDGLTARLREADARYMALLKAVADGAAMQPKTVVLDLGPNVRAKLTRYGSLCGRTEG